MSTSDPVRYHLELGGVLLPVRAVAGREALSKPFRFDARLVLPAARQLDPDDLVKTRAAIVLSRDGELRRRIEGVVTDIAIGATVSGEPELEVRVEPRLALLRWRSDIRVFRDRTAPEIVAELFTETALPFELRLSGTYPRRAYCVQMRETLLDFCSRLLEDEGISYFFGEGDVVVLADSPAGYEVFEPRLVMPFRGAVDLVRDAEVVSEIGERRSATAALVTLNDFDPARPKLDLTASARVGAASDRLGAEHYDYPGEHSTPEEGARKAMLVAESFACAAEALVGRSHVPQIAPGVIAALIDLPQGLEDGEVVFTAVEHSHDVEAGGFSNRFSALRADRTWRPSRQTRAPALENPLTAWVTGPPGEDIHTDEMGRVKVVFPWDRRQTRDDRCSDWVPVLQDNTGQSVAIPRVGWEVLVHFLEGDPDRPVVLGRVYNGADVFPEALPRGKTKSKLQSLSSPGRDGANTIELEDAAGSEHVLVHAERDQTAVVANDRRKDIVANESEVIARDETVAIGSNHRAVVGQDLLETVGSNQTWTVAADRSVSIGADASATVAKDHHVRIGATHFRRIGTDDAVMVKDLRERVGAVIVEASVGPSSTSAKKAMALTVGGALVEVARKDKAESATLARAETIGGVLLSRSGAGTVATAKARATTIGGALAVTAVQGVSLTSKALVKITAGQAALEGKASITLKVGGSSVILKDGVISLKADSVVTLAGDDAELGSDESMQS